MKKAPRTKSGFGGLACLPTQWTHKGGTSEHYTNAAASTSREEAPYVLQKPLVQINGFPQHFLHCTYKLVICQLQGYERSHAFEMLLNYGVQGERRLFAVAICNVQMIRLWIWGGVPLALHTASPTEHRQKCCCVLR